MLSGRNPWVRADLADEGFGSTLLLVCALGARASTDKRVLLPDHTDDWRTAGWRWFQRVQGVRKVLNLSIPNLYDIQIPAVSGFLWTCSGGVADCGT